MIYTRCYANEFRHRAIEQLLWMSTASRGLSLDVKSLEEALFKLFHFGSNRRVAFGSHDSQKVVDFTSEKCGGLTMLAMGDENGRRRMDGRRKSVEHASRCRRNWKQIKRMESRINQGG